MVRVVSPSNVRKCGVVEYISVIADSQNCVVAMVPKYSFGLIVRWHVKRFSSLIRSSVRRHDLCWLSIFSGYVFFP